eukprot:1196163-Prorocentrum_minimum.AAC.6
MAARCVVTDLSVKNKFSTQPQDRTLSDTNTIRDPKVRDPCLRDQLITHTNLRRKSISYSEPTLRTNPAPRRGSLTKSRAAPGIPDQIPRRAGDPRPNPADPRPNPAPHLAPGGGALQQVLGGGGDKEGGQRRRELCHSALRVAQNDSLDRPLRWPQLRGSRKGAEGGRRGVRGRS